MAYSKILAFGDIQPLDFLISTWSVDIERTDALRRLWDECERAAELPAEWVVEVSYEDRMNLES